MNKNLNKPADLNQNALEGSAAYRYILKRVWDDSGPVVVFVGLNPSTQDPSVDNATVRVCIGYAKRWGFGSLRLVNLFGRCADTPALLMSSADPVGPQNDEWIRRTCSEADLLVLAWGRHGNYLGRASSVLRALDNPYCLGILANGQPAHPLYKSRELTPVPYSHQTLLSHE